MQPVFHRRSVAAFGGLMTDETLAMLERWRPAIEVREPLDVPGEMARLTLDIVTGALFHAHVGEEPEKIAWAVNVLSRTRLPFRGALLPAAPRADPAQPPLPGRATHRGPGRLLDHRRSAAAVGETRRICWRS
jgi:cytochrome P450